MRFPEGPLVDGDVALRPWRPGDAEWYASVTPDPDIQRFTAEPPDLTADQVRVAIEKMLDTQAHLGVAITDTVTGELLGNAGLVQAQADSSVGEISYWVAPGARNRGVATRAVGLLVQWAWTVGLRRVELYIRAGNEASGRVAERAGLSYDRTVTDYSVVKGESWTAVFYGLPNPDVG